MPTQIPAPRVALTDPTTGLTNRPWFLFLDAVYKATGVGESFLNHTNTISGNYSPTNADWHLYCTAAAIITLPLAALRAKELVVTNAGTGVVTIVPESPETINGSTSLIIDFQWTTLQIRPIVGGFVVQ